MAEEGGSEAKAVSSSCGSSAARASRSRCFKVYKYALILLLVLFFIVTLASTPWMPDLVRDIFKEWNTTTVAMNYSGAEPLQVTDAVVYGVIFSSMMITIIYVLVGVIVLYKECFISSILYGITTILIAAASVCCIKYTIFLITTITEFVLAPLIILFGILIKRADRLAPESSQKLTNEEETTTDSLKKKQRPEADEADTENVKV